MRSGEVIIRLIDKDYLIEEIRCSPVGQLLIRKHNLDGMIEKFPEVDAEPVRHGKWDYVTVAEEGYWKCSCCNFPTEAFGAKRLYKYCPFCGAKMDADREKEDDKTD